MIQKEYKLSIGGFLQEYACDDPKGPLLMIARAEDISL